MTLNEKIGVILKQHKEGEEFFNALDFMIKGDRSILEDFLLGNEALIFKDKLLCKNWIFIDDSYYLGRTNKVKSMYRYSK